MAIRQRRYRREEFAQRGEEIYERAIRPQVEANHKGKIVAIDIETGDWELDTDEIIACDRLEKRRPEAQIWFLRIGYPSVRRICRRRL